MLEQLLAYYQHEAAEPCWAGSIHAERCKATAELLAELQRRREGEE